ncbi:MULTISPECIES: collagen-like repeat preface domain-containing protein [Paenibacillus]|uniref:collagen-like repeat preface domain-containing protein n=1 Tax=Paenibacillus TaxID=44249 RepID=UPI0030FC80E5|nr:collagen-like repeat preface domain-containing protein [Paenibacillus sp.]
MPVRGSKLKLSKGDFIEISIPFKELERLKDLLILFSKTAPAAISKPTPFNIGALQGILKELLLFTYTSVFPVAVKAELQSVLELAITGLEVGPFPRLNTSISLQYLLAELMQITLLLSISPLNKDHLVGEIRSTNVALVIASVGISGTSSAV